MKRRFTEDSWRKEPWFRSLAAALASLRTEAEIADFLRDVGTLSELQAWSERLEVARLLAKGFSYRQVAKATGASTTTVTRVAHFLENGEGGYRKILRVHRHHRMLKQVQTPPAPPQDAALPPEATLIAQAPADAAQAPFHAAAAVPVPDQVTRESGPENAGAQSEAQKPLSPLQKYLGRR